MMCPLKFISGEWMGDEDCERQCAWRIGVLDDDGVTMRFFCAMTASGMSQLGESGVESFILWDEVAMEEKGTDDE